MNAHDSIRRLEYLLRLGYPYSMTKEDVKAIRGVLAEVERLTEKIYHLSNARRKDCAELDRLRGFEPDENEALTGGREK